MGLEVCQQLTGVMPTPLSDSQLGGALAGLGGIMGFQRIVKEILNINLPKEETRSDWLKRPLREEQIEYAVADVHYLYRLYPKLMSRLKKLNRQNWLAEECERLLRTLAKNDNAANYYRRVKLAWKLRPQELLILKQLVLWREQEARTRDVPRNKVVDDNTLWNIAGMKPLAVREDGKELLQIVAEGLAVDKDLLPKQLDRPLSPQAGQWLKLMKETVNAKAEVLEIPPELLARKKALE